MEIEIDLWKEIVEPLLPLLEELDQIERQAAGEAVPSDDETTPED